MTSAQTTIPQAWSLMGQADLPPSVVFSETEMDLWPYRRRTVALLRRYARASVEVGRLPSLLGREFFRTRVTSYTMRNFEDVVIFVTDMEQAIEKLTAIEKKILAMNVLEEYSTDEVARLLGCTPRNVRRLLQDALDQLSRILLAGGLMEELPSAASCPKTGSVLIWLVVVYAIVGGAFASGVHVWSDTRKIAETSLVDDSKNILISDSGKENHVGISRHVQPVFKITQGQPLRGSLGRLPCPPRVFTSLHVSMFCWIEDTPAHAGMIVLGVIKDRLLLSREFSDNSFGLVSKNRSFSDIGEMYGRDYGYSLCNLNWLWTGNGYPRTLILPHLTLDGSNTVLRSLRLLLSDSKLLSGIHFVHQGSGISALGLTGHNLGLIGRHLDLRANKNGSGKSGQETENGNPISSSRDRQRLPGDGDSLLLKRFEFIPTNQLHKKWFRWFSAFLGLLACGFGIGLLRDNRRLDRWLSDTTRGGLAFLLVFVGMLILCHGALLL